MEQQTLSIEFYLSSEMTACSYGWAYSQVLFCTTIGQWQGAFWKVHNEFPCFLILLHVVSKLHALRYHFTKFLWLIRGWLPTVCFICYCRESSLVRRQACMLQSYSELQTGGVLRRGKRNRNDKKLQMFGEPEGQCGNCQREQITAEITRREIREGTLL